MLAILSGMLQGPEFNALQVVIVAAFLVGSLLISAFVPRFLRGAKLSSVPARRRGAAAVLIVLAVWAGILGHGVVFGSWRGPSRWQAIHQLAIQFASSWALALVFFLIGGLCLVLASKALRPAVA
jgi:hypothetical protein